MACAGGWGCVLGAGELTEVSNLPFVKAQAFVLRLGRWLGLGSCCDFGLVTELPSHFHFPYL